ncbi:CHRD domain-containing protein [Pedobacter metabolipauper]|uniref:CHRD domain-containing protein n=1 Tax=Pedobacter metabolipauper TaxID=425513 RepID=A0A4V3D149_9SPHI|nr:CHRD domain-containing protein [Pedobacter metabolipauper]TDQ09247.1 hypothetical protein ATK78_1401 [Pedobacter metabolipauper]
MWDYTTKGFISKTIAVLMFVTLASCKKEESAEQVRIKAPVRTYQVTARIDKKGTNSSSTGTAVLKGVYDEETKIFSYALEYKDISPVLITLRSGAKGTTGTVVKELFSTSKSGDVPLDGKLTLSPLQERTLLKGQWFVVLYNTLMAPEISGYLTLKQQ